MKNDPWEGFFEAEQSITRAMLRPIQGRARPPG
jgi:hypothetical protein